MVCFNSSITYRGNHVERLVQDLACSSLSHFKAESPVYSSMILMAKCMEIGEAYVSTCGERRVRFTYAWGGHSMSHTLSLDYLGRQLIELFNRSIYCREFGALDCEQSISGRLILAEIAEQFADKLQKTDEIILQRTHCIGFIRLILEFIGWLFYSLSDPVMFSFSLRARNLEGDDQQSSLPNTCHAALMLRSFSERQVAQLRKQDSNNSKQDTDNSKQDTEFFSPALLEIEPGYSWGITGRQTFTKASLQKRVVA